MMKSVLQVLLVIGSFGSFGQDKQIILKGDSLIVRDENIATDPFNFGRDPLTHLTSMVKNSKPTIELHTVPNRHTDNDVDTTYGIKFGHDSFNIYKWDKQDNALLHAEISTDKFATKHGITVGMSKSQVKHLLKDYGITIIPKYLILENTEIIEYLSLEFDNDILRRIEFEGYFD